MIEWCMCLWWCIYASDVWDPYYNGDIMELEKSTTKSSPLVLNDYGWFNSVSSMLNQLSWPTLQSRHKLSRLYIHCTKYFIIHYLCQFLCTIYQQYDLQDNIIHYITSCLDSRSKQLFFKNHKWLEQVTNTSYWNHRYWHFSLKPS